MCGGKDRFRWDDKDGRGTYYCNQCGAGDGYTLLRKVHRWDFKTTVAEVRRVLELSPATQNSGIERPPRNAFRQVLQGARPIKASGTVASYLRSRGLTTPDSKALYEHPSLWESKTKREYPALIAVVCAPDGEQINLHRTYLTHPGRKADVPQPRKLMKPIRRVPGGGAIRLFDASIGRGGRDSTGCASTLRVTCMGHAVCCRNGKACTA